MSHRDSEISEEDYGRLNTISDKIIGCAISVHRALGPGLLESVYESALCLEFEEQGIVFERQVRIPVSYRNRTIGEFKADIVVERGIVIELKSVDRFDPVFDAQLLSYMKLGGYHLGLLINFNKRLLKDGIKRKILA